MHQRRAEEGVHALVGEPLAFEHAIVGAQVRDGERLALEHEPIEHASLAERERVAEPIVGEPDGRAGAQAQLRVDIGHAVRVLREQDD